MDGAGPIGHQIAGHLRKRVEAIECPWNENVEVVPVGLGDPGEDIRGAVLDHSENVHTHPTEHGRKAQ